MILLTGLIIFSELIVLFSIFFTVSGKYLFLASFSSFWMNGASWGHSLIVFLYESPWVLGITKILIWINISTIYLLSASLSIKFSAYLSSAISGKSIDSSKRYYTSESEKTYLNCSHPEIHFHVHHQYLNEHKCNLVVTPSWKLVKFNFS